MLNFSRGKIIMVILVCLLGLAYAAPNMFSEKTKEWAAANIPVWLPHQGINLGLDLQGGSHLLLQVDLSAVMKDKLDTVLTTARSDLAKQKIRPLKSIVELQDDKAEFTFSSVDDADNARKLIAKLDPTMTVSKVGEVVTAQYEESAVNDIKVKTLEQSIEIVRRRIDETGTREPVIQRQGEDRIVVQLPGLDDPTRIKEILGRTAKLSFHLVDLNNSPLALRLPSVDAGGAEVPLVRRPVLTGDMLVDANPTMDPQSGSAIVSFKLNNIGARLFCNTTRENVSKPFAIVLDNEVISAPRINEAICGGGAVISGNFNIQSANDLALLLRAGALPAPLKVMEERTVGPSLGSDSVEAGKTAVMFAMLFVAIYMIWNYRLVFGSLANIALVINLVLIIAVLSMLQATLTLPGIAGIVLTIGMAVDANVLIFERLKEELRAGKTPIVAIDSAYKNAMSSIIDANMTSIIAAVFLFMLGAGPVRGFAVTLIIGTFTSLFSALYVSRLLMVTWLRAKRPAQLVL
ncbi:MAG: protein translocase subunit SecD [Alphaproteobacteria bacterium]|nr:protein translocase subunit SecD [Alphaproteobacteria bacterium]